MKLHLRTRFSLWPILLSPLALTIAHCSKPLVDPPLLSTAKVGGTLTRELTHLQTCHEVDEQLRIRLAAQIDAEVNQALDSELAIRKADRDRSVDPCARFETRYLFEDDVAVAYSPSPVGAPSSENGAQSSSTTNNQVATVDEADVVKNTNKYVFQLSGDKLHIIDAFPAATARVVSSLTIEGSPVSLLIDGNRAIVFSAAVPSDALPQGDAPMRSRLPCTYGYDCDFSGDGRATLVTIIDISNLQEPKRISSLKTSASYLTARRIGSEIHLMTQFAFRPKDVVTTIAYDELRSTCSDDEALKALVATARTKNHQLIVQAPAEALVPSITRRNAGSDDVSISLACDGFYASSVTDSSSVLNVMSFRSDDDASVPSVSSVIGRPGPIYVSENAVYIASRYAAAQGFAWSYTEAKPVEEVSAVHKFSLTSGRGAYVASAVLGGRVLNQFAMDEFNGALRIASTIGHLPGPTENRLTTLEHANMNQTGIASGFAPGEDIRSVRFDGARAFVVTFKKTDPLFYFDLSNNAEPKVLGELKVPGFSTYMHMLDDNHLLTIGYDADDHGDFAFFDGMLVQIFDVSNPSAMTQTSKLLIGTRGSSSEALGNHLAFNYFAPKGKLALPVTRCEGGDDGTFGTLMTFSGTMLFDVNAQAGVSLAAELPVGPQTSTDQCGRWWSDASSTVRRTIFMDDTVWSLTSDALTAHALGGAEQKKLSL